MGDAFLLATMEDPMTSEVHKKNMTAKDGTVLDSESCGPVYRGSDCCFNSCAYTSDHYHCQVCGMGSPEVSQALAHIQASPACRKDLTIHYPACSVTIPTDAANSLYNALYSGFTAQNTYPTAGFSGYSQIESFQWHPSMSEKVAICNSQLSPCCSSNGASYIPVESQLCSPIGDLYSKVTGPMRDLVSLPAKSAGSAIDSQAWFAPYNPQQMQKVAYKFSDQNAPSQTNFLPLDPSEQRHHQDLNSASIGDANVNPPSSYCGKGDVMKEPYCVYASQSVPGMLSEDTFFSLQLPDEALKQADIQQSPLPQIMLNDVSVVNKSASQVEVSGNCSRVENHFTQEHFGHYMTTCNPYPPSEEHDNTSGRSTEISNQASSAASDSDESDIIVEDTGDELGSQMTESEVFIEDIKCSLLQGVVSEEDDQPCHKGENLDDIHKESEKIEPRSKLSSVTPLSSCVSPYTILKCVICERNVSDSNPGNVCFQMSTQMPLTTSSQTPVISKLNEVVAVDITDYLDVSGKFMCQSCFNLVDAVDCLESKLESLKQNITEMVKTGSKPLIVGDNHYTNLTIKRKLPFVCVQDVQALIQQRSIMGDTSTPRSMGSQEMDIDTRHKDYLLLSNQDMISDKIKGDTHHSSKLTCEIDHKAQTSLVVKLKNLPKLPEVSPREYHLPIQLVSEGKKQVELQSSCTLSSQDVAPFRMESEKTNGLDISKVEVVDHGANSNEEVVKSLIGYREEGESLQLLSRKAFEEKNNAQHKEGVSNVTKAGITFINAHSSEEQQPHSSECTPQNCYEILSQEKMRLEKVNNENNTRQHLTFTCDLCKEMFSSNKNLEDHISLYSKVDPLLCEACGKMCHDQAQLDDHVFYVHFIYQKHCEICNMKFCNPCMYKVHQQSHIGEKPYSCSQAQSFVIQSSAIDHESVCSESPPYICEICDQTFPVHSEIEQHMKLVHEQKKAVVECGKCNKTFSKPSDLQAHLRSHSNERQFECKICGRRYKSLGNLNHHAKSHGKIKPYTCELCSQGFIRKDFFETHMNSHKGDKPFKCDKCPKGFWSKSYLQVHLNWHLDKTKKVTCPICQKSFSQRLNVHMRSHTGERPHLCKKCPKKFITGSALKKHIRQVHKMDHSASELFSDLHGE